MDDFAAEDREAPGQRYGILIVDDEEAILESLEFTLGTEYRVFVATNGRDGLAIFDAEEIALVIADQNMPGMSGVEFLEKVIERDVRAIRMMLTGYADISSLARAINSGRIYRYITKPWDDNQLRMVIERAVEHYQLTTKNQQLLAEKTSLLENMGDGLIAVDADGLITALNPRAMTLLKLDDAPALPANATQILADFPQLMSLVEATLREGVAQPHQGVSFDASQYLLASTSLIQPPEHSSPTGIILLLSNVTELRNLQNRLVQQEHQAQRQALLNELAARFRHRIGNDLGGIQLSAKRIQQPELSAEKRQQSLELILQAVEE
ncbi:MAG: response regulator, partial [Myxococcales bacterium]|nr:response regulator [Myxococcales bacterium]